MAQTLQPGQTQQPEQERRESGARHRVSRVLHPVARVFVALAALLAFGLFGLLVVVWHAARRRHRVGPDCRGCRRRRHFTLAVTSVLAFLVVVGSGLSLHQHTTGPGLPACATQRSALVHGPMGVASSDSDRGAVWSQTRNVLTSPVSGLTRHYVNDRGGGLCEVHSMTVGFLPSAAADSGVAVGGVVLMDENARTSEAGWEALARHESRHVNQWAVLTLAGGPAAMPLLYAADDAFFPDSRNHFERAADLEDGGYPVVDSLGPRPQWPNVAVLGLLLLVVFRRRARWVSRVLIGGRMAARAHQPGLCAVHSRGWFRLTPPEGPRPAPTRDSAP